MKPKRHPSYVSQINDDLSSPWPLIFTIGILVGLYLYLDKGYSGVFPSAFAAFLILSLSLKTKTYHETVCPNCQDSIQVDIPLKSGVSFTAKCNRCKIEWDLGMVRQPWVRYRPSNHTSFRKQSDKEN